MMRAHTVLLMSLGLLLPACLDSSSPTDESSSTDLVDRQPRQVCPPGEQWQCYSGPSDSDGVGACERGVKTCNADGTGYGECIGEVIPTAELCNGIDDDCDGVV